MSYQVASESRMCRLRSGLQEVAGSAATPRQGGFDVRAADVRIRRRLQLPHDVRDASERRTGAAHPTTAAVAPARDDVRRAVRRSDQLSRRVHRATPGTAVHRPTVPGTRCRSAGRCRGRVGVALSTVLAGVGLLFGSRPSDHYFRSVCLFVCLSVCLFVQSFSQLSSIRFGSN